MNTPVINTWYTNLTGQLFKVKMVMYSKANISHIVIEYVNGTSQVLNHHEWECLKLMKHTVEQFKKQNLETEELSF